MVDKLVEKISQYEIVTNLLPGAVFYVFMEYVFEVEILKNVNSEVETIIICYFVGLTIGRISSLIIEPAIKKKIEFANYADYIEATKLDSKIDLLNEKANVYRSFVATILILVICDIAVKLYMSESLFEEKLIILIILFVIYTFSYIKQVEYVKKRVTKTLKDKEGVMLCHMK